MFGGAGRWPVRIKGRKPAPPSAAPKELRWRALSLALAVFAILCATYFLPPTSRAWEQLEVLATVLRFNLRGQQPMDDSIRILGITQQNISTLAEYGEQYPFARDIHAVVLRRLADAGAKVIVVDILFSEEGSWDPEEDRALRNAITYCTNKGCEVVLAAAMDVSVLPGATAKHLVTPAPIIMEAKPRLGIANVSEKLSYRLNEQGGFDASGYGELLDSEAWAAWYALQAAEGIDFKRGGPSKPFVINYACQPERYAGLLYGLETVFPEAFSAQEWSSIQAERQQLKAGVPQVTKPDRASDLNNQFAGKVVFYGSRNPADNDFFNTPFGVMFGVDTIAQSFNTIQSRRFIRPVGKLVLCLLALLLTAVALIASLTRPLRFAVLCGIVLLLILVVTDVLLFLDLRDLPLAFTTASFAIPFLACVIYGGSVEEAARKKIRATFIRYMSDELVAQLVDDPKLADLGGQGLDVAVMFVDIRNYSTLTEQLDPQQTVWMLNALLGELTDVVRSNDGFVDKYLGDGLLACFGGPVPTRNPSADAVAAALEMLVVLHRDVNPKLLAANLPELRIGIGIHYGPVVMGNIGSESRMDFTVVGDSVNVAARVESCTKETGWAVLVTREVAQAAEGFDFELVGEQQVKGRMQTVELFRPVSEELGDRLRI